MKQISSKTTIFQKYVFPWLLSAVSLIFLPDAVENPAILFAIIAGNITVWSLWKIYVADAQIVFIENEELLIKKKGTLERIHFRDISSVDQEFHLSIDVELNSGRKFYFIPSSSDLNWMLESSTVETIKEYQKSQQTAPRNVG